VHHPDVRLHVEPFVPLAVDLDGHERARHDVGAALGEEAAPGDTGALVVRLPMPPGASPTLWNADERFRQAYLDPFPRYYQTADAGYIDDDGYWRRSSRP
jgi:acyl-coenzyme A synthetase/AMP-(fatty) acid ligase